jgi:hypothetical protein
MGSRLEIIPELTNLLLDFTVSVLVNKPSDLVQYASDYFGKLLEDRGGDPSSTDKNTSSSKSAKPATSTSFKGPRTPSTDSNHVDEEDEELSEYLMKRTFLALHSSLESEMLSRILRIQSPYRHIYNRQEELENLQADCIQNKECLFAIPSFRAKNMFFSGNVFRLFDTTSVSSLSKKKSTYISRITQT